MSVDNQIRPLYQDALRRIAELEAGNTALSDALDYLKGLTHDQYAELRKDAARYRHMRNNSTFQNRNGPGLYWYLPRYDRNLPLGDRLDAAIDAAMGEQS
jgi:hypothetical protein